MEGNTRNIELSVLSGDVQDNANGIAIDIQVHSGP